MDQFYLSDAVIVHLSRDLALKHVTVPRAGAWYLRVWQGKLCDKYSLIKTIMSDLFSLTINSAGLVQMFCSRPSLLYLSFLGVILNIILTFIQPVVRKTKHDRSLRMI
jgi:hypothetical protein